MYSMFLGFLWFSLSHNKVVVAKDHTRSTYINIFSNSLRNYSCYYMMQHLYELC